MAKLNIIYEVTDDSEEIIKMIEDHVNLNKPDEKDIFDMIQKKFQTAFDEGRRFQKHISMQSNFKDSLLHKTEI